MFAAVVSRPDIAYSIGKLAQYSSNPGQAHWNLEKRVLVYLYMTRDRELCLRGEHLCLHAYSDVDFAGDSEDQKSVGGYAVFLREGAVSWSSKKQPTITLSSTEAEYVALSAATTEVLWIHHFLEDTMGFSFSELTAIFKDNQSAIAFAQNHSNISRMKHIQVKYHFVQDLIKDGTIELIYRNTRMMTADILMKPLPPSTHAPHAERLGLCPSRIKGEYW
jgi:hypothetical protein